MFKKNYNLLGEKTKTNYTISQPLTRCIRLVFGVNLSDFFVVAENIVILFLSI